MLQRGPPLLSPFLGEGSPAKIDREKRKKGYPCSNLCTAGPSQLGSRLVTPGSHPMPTFFQGMIEYDGNPWLRNKRFYDGTPAYLEQVVVFKLTKPDMHPEMFKVYPWLGPRNVVA